MTNLYILPKDAMKTRKFEAGGPTVAQTSRLVSFFKVVFIENANSSAASSTLYLRQAK